MVLGISGGSIGRHYITSVEERGGHGHVVGTEELESVSFCDGELLFVLGPAFWL